LFLEIALVFGTWVYSHVVFALFGYFLLEIVDVHIYAFLGLSLVLDCRGERIDLLLEVFGVDEGLCSAVSTLFVHLGLWISSGVQWGLWVYRFLSWFSRWWSFVFWLFWHSHLRRSFYRLISFCICASARTGLSASCGPLGCSTSVGLRAFSIDFETYFKLYVYMFDYYRLLANCSSITIFWTLYAILELGNHKTWTMLIYPIFTLCWMFGENSTISLPKITSAHSP
jgi:hypothetical protein